MTLSELKASQFLQSTASEIQVRKHLSAVKLNEDSNKAKDQEGRSLSSPIQDQVTLSKEAQALAASNRPPSNNHSFEQPPSPFDR